MHQRHNEVLKYLRACESNKPDQILSQGHGFWMVIKYSTHSRWKFYSTTNMVGEADVTFGIGASLGYSCETATEECKLTHGISVGAGMLDIGLGGEYNFTDGSYTMGATVEVGPCNAFLNYAIISFTCDRPMFPGGIVSLQYEFGWKRNPYEAYWVLVHTSQIAAAGGYDEFARTAFGDRVHPELDLNYQMMDSGDRSALWIRYYKRGIRLIEFN